MTDQQIDPEDPAALEFVRAGAERVVAGMDDRDRARSAMIYAHVTALIDLVQASGDGQELSKYAIERIMFDLPMDYRSAFMLDTLNAVGVPGASDEQLQQALAGTERGRMQKQRERFEYKVMTIALTDAQETACALGKAGWRFVGQSAPTFPRRSLDVSPEPPPAVTLTFERALDESKQTTDVRPATAIAPYGDDPTHQPEADTVPAAAEAGSGDGRGNRGHLPVVG